MIMSMTELGKRYYLRKSKHRKTKIWGSTQEAKRKARKTVYLAKYEVEINRFADGTRRDH